MGFIWKAGIFPIASHRHQHSGLISCVGASIKSPYNQAFEATDYRASRLVLAAINSRIVVGFRQGVTGRNMLSNRNPSVHRAGSACSISSALHSLQVRAQTRSLICLPFMLPMSISCSWWPTNTRPRSKADALSCAFGHK